MSRFSGYDFDSLTRLSLSVNRPYIDAGGPECRASNKYQQQSSLPFPFELENHFTRPIEAWATQSRIKSVACMV